MGLFRKKNDEASLPDESSAAASIPADDSSAANDADATLVIEPEPAAPTSSADETALLEAVDSELADEGDEAAAQDAQEDATDAEAEGDADADGADADDLDADDAPVYVGRHSHRASNDSKPADEPTAADEPAADQTALLTDVSDEETAQILDAIGSDEDFDGTFEPEGEPPFGTAVIGSVLDDTPDENVERYVAPSHVAPKKKMSTGKKVGIVIGAFVVLLVAAYIAGSVYFMKHFGFDTTISDIDCSYMTVEEVEKLLSDKAGKYSMEVVGREDMKGTIAGSDIAFKYDAEAGQVAAMLDAQNPFMFPVRFVEQKLMHKENDPQTIEFTFDQDALGSAVSGLEMLDESKSRKPTDAYPEFDQEKDEYVAHPEDRGTLVDKEKAVKTISDKAKLAISEVDLDKEKCYVEPKVTTETPELVERIELLDKYTPFALTYEFDDGHTEQLNGEDMFEWLIKDENGKPTEEFDDEAVADWVREFAKKYDRFGQKRVFKSVDGETYEVEGGTYGWQVDEAAEIEAIKEMLETKKSETREPIWVGKSAVLTEGTEPDWGDTYIELNIAKQHMYVVEKGKKIAEYDVVTGLPNGKRDTPTGVYDIMEKMQNKTLRGERNAQGVPEYETPVAYWLRVTGDGVGFHDASWQPSFGGERYTYAGSHGCINMSYSDVQELYSLVETGTPVVIHYN